MFLALVTLLVMGISSSGGGPPDVKNFTPVLSKELEFRIDDYKIALVGKVIVYQNQNDENEFVRVYYRQVAIISERAQANNTAGTDSRDTNLSNLKYHSQEETEALSRAQKAMDAFAYVQWRTVRDTRTGQEIRNGSFQSWLLEQNGNWTFTNGYNLDTSPFSELSKGDPKKRIIVGIKFTLVGAIHIVRVDQDDIPNLFKEVADEKK